MEGPLTSLVKVEESFACKICTILRLLQVAHRKKVGLAFKKT